MYIMWRIKVVRGVEKDRCNLWHEDCFYQSKEEKPDRRKREYLKREEKGWRKKELRKSIRSVDVFLQKQETSTGRQVDNRVCVSLHS